MTVKRTLHRPSLVSALCLALVTAACGGGGDSSAPPTPRPQTFGIMLDTGAGTADTITVQVLGVFAEDVRSGLSPNLLIDSPQSVTICDPRSGTSGLILARVPGSTTYTRLRLLLGQSGRAVRSNGEAVAVHVSATDLAATSNGPFALGGDQVLQLAHTGTNVATRTDGSLDVSFGLELRTGVVPVRELVATVASIEPARQSANVTVAALGGAVARVEFRTDGQFTDADGQRRGGREFASRLTPGDELSCSGVRASDGRIDCRSATNRGRRSGQGREPEYTGRIRRIVSDRRRFVIQAFTVRDASGHDRAIAREVTVDASNAVIRRDVGSTYEPAAFADLKIGVLVEAEGRLAQDGTLIATEVEIEDDDTGHNSGEVEGRVAGVRSDLGLIDIVPRGDDPLIVGGQRVDRAVVVVDASTVIYRDDRDRRIALGEIRNTDRIWVYGRVDNSGRVLASRVRVRFDD